MFILENNLCPCLIAFSFGKVDNLQCFQLVFFLVKVFSSCWGHQKLKKVLEKHNIFSLL